MKKDKIQIDVLRALIKGERVLYEGLPGDADHLAGDRIAIVCGNGAAAFIFKPSEIFFDLARCEKSDKVAPLFLQQHDDVLLAATREARIIDDKGKVARLHTNGPLRVWIAEALCKMFDPLEARLYAAPGVGRVLALDASGELLGVIMPCRVYDDKPGEGA